MTLPYGAWRQARVGARAAVGQLPHEPPRMTNLRNSIIVYLGRSENLGQYRGQSVQLCSDLVQ
jgi:hypothetical protein